MATIKIYKTHTCPYCKMETEYVKEKGFTPEEIYVDENPALASEMMQVSGQLGVPFTIIKADDGAEVKFNGFDKKKINETLNITE